MFGRRKKKAQIKIPESFKKLEGERIELGYSNQAGVLESVYPIYSKSKSKSGDRYLGSVIIQEVQEGRRGTSRNKYIVGVSFNAPGEAVYRDIVGTRDSLHDAEFLADETARDIAQRIAKINSLPLEDLVFEDQKTMEDRELARKLDSLRPVVFLVLLSGGVALSLSSLTATGNTISNLTQTTPGLLGIIFFIVGLAGMFFYFKKK